jgi:hypothetical protein
MAGLVMETVNSYDRAGAIFDAILGQKRLGEFLDPRTNQVPVGLLPYARDFMPAVSPSKVESDLANRLDLLTLDIFRSWLTRDLNNTPPPATAELRQRLIGHRRLENSLFGHAEGIALDGILTPEHAELCLRRIWIDRGMRALQDPALAARLRLSKSQREAVGLLLEQKFQISDAETDAQTPLVGLMPAQPELRIMSEQIASDSRERLGQTDEMIWDTLTPAQSRLLRQILFDKTQPVRSPAAKGKRSSRRG